MGSLVSEYGFKKVWNGFLFYKKIIWTGFTGLFCLNGMDSYLIFVAFLKKATNRNRLRRTIQFSLQKLSNISQAKLEYKFY